MVTTTRLMTIEQLEREGAPEGRYELINGALVEMSPSSIDASRIAALFITYVGMHIIPRNLGIMVGADGGFAVFSGQQTVRVPDAAFVSTERLPPPDQRRGFWRLAPDIAVEVVSPSDRVRDVTAKAAMWLEAGVAPRLGRPSREPDDYRLCGRPRAAGAHRRRHANWWRRVAGVPIARLQDIRRGVRLSRPYT